MNYLELKTLLGTDDYKNLNAQAAAAKLNEPTIEQSRAVAKLTTLNYLMGATDVWDKLTLSLSSPAFPEELKVKIRKFQTTVTVYEQTDYANFVSETGTLVALGIITQEEVDGFMALSKEFVSPAQELLGTPVTITDVKAARNYDLYLQLEGERDALLQQAATKEAQLSDILAGLDVEAS